MTDETLKYLDDLKNGKPIPLTKDSPNEISELIINLKNLGFLYKPNKYTYASEFNNRKYLTKLIELKSWSEFLNWLDEQKTDSNIVNDFSGSTIGQVNQSSNFSNSPQTNNITANNKADLKTKPIIKFWKLISENKLISSIIFVIILYLIKVIFGIDLK
ncbi:hypothetical protein ACW5R3_12360 [Bizionia sp. KMM 8389]